MPPSSLEQIRSGLSLHHPPQNPHPQKRASVLIPLLERGGEIRVLLTRRADALRSHSGQVSFPGGKQDPGDPSALHTALRETREEIGLLPDQVEILGTLDQIISLHHYLVTPFVGWISSSFIPRLNPMEIESVFEVPLAFLMNPENHWSEELRRRSIPVISHHFQYGEYDIWGLTAKLLIRLLEIGLGHNPDYLVHHPDGPSWIQLAQEYDGIEAPF